MIMLHISFYRKHLTPIIFLSVFGITYYKFSHTLVSADERNWH